MPAPIISNLILTLYVYIQNLTIYKIKRNLTLHNFLHILKGNRNFEFNTYELLKIVLNERIIKIKDKTKIGYDLDKLINETIL